MGPIAMKRSLPLPVALAAWAAFAGSAAAQAALQWHFESSGGVPVKLVWQSEAGRSYDLFQSPDLTGWVHVDGFPQPGTGGAMEHPFAAGTRGYFRIVSEPAAGDGMVLIPAGGFLMGDPSDPPVGSSAELPVHAVAVGAFRLAACEVTKALWNYYWHPIYYDYSSDYSTSPVGSFAPNGYGLHDMAGNVSEWCWDWQSAAYYASSPATDPRGPDTGTSWRIYRGGNWSDDADECRASCRVPGYVGADDTGSRVLGFRPARSAAP